MRTISERGMPCFSGSCSEIYNEKAFSPFGLNDLHLPVAVELCATSFAFLVHPALEETEIIRCAQAIREVGLEASTGEIAPCMRVAG